jgi:hypothetical protein
MIQFTSIVKQSSGSWLFSWNSTGATTYRVVLYGQQIATTTTNSYAWEGQGYNTFPPPLEVVDTDFAQSELYLPFLVVQWYSEPGADSYLIQQNVAGNWITVGSQFEEGSWVYTYQTPTLIDERPYQYQVIAVDSLGNQATPRQYNVFIVTPPTPPDGQVQVTYSNPALTILA